LPAAHAEVHTLNAGYRRTSSQVLVRAIDRPTRANLDWAAYHANFMNAEPPPESEDRASGAPETARPFGGTLDADSLTSTMRRTPLTDDERGHPLALPPLVELLSARKLGAGLEEVVSAVRSETWGRGGGGANARQAAAELFLHDTGSATELWVKVEVQPWSKALGDLPDEDGDGVPELYGRVRADLVSAEAVRVMRDEYAGKVLGPAEIKAWANQLASYWYPSYNTDLVPPPRSWPEADTEEAIRKELGDATWSAPVVVLRGKPQGKPTYNVFLVGSAAAPPGAPAVRGAAVALAKGRASAHPKPVIEAVKRELGAHGGTWPAWSKQVAAFHETVRGKLRAAPAKVKGIAGAGGFLFYRNELEFVVGGDLGKQPAGKNPLPVIIEFKDALAARGVDFLFVPVPNKVEVFPERLDAKHAPLVGQVVTPFGRKLISDLGGAGVEVIDLLPRFLAERRNDAAAHEALYQAQDTHWSDRGLELAASVVAARIKQYPWFAELARRGRRFATKDVTFTRHGDLHSRLPEAQRARYQPETLVGRQVLGPDGAPYDDDPDSPIVVLGDSFTGVYELTECEHAGVSAHIAKEIGYPVDLVMSYGGGPNVRQKLLRRGVEDLGKKRLVIWMMTARDLYHYWENWEPLKLP
jgi:hypothetical protein